MTTEQLKKEIETLEESIRVYNKRIRLHQKMIEADEIDRKADQQVLATRRAQLQNAEK